MIIRGLILLAIMMGGTYAMFQSFHDYDDKEFIVLLDAIQNPFTSLILTKASPLGYNIEYTKDEDKIESLLIFLQDYKIRKLKPEDIRLEDKIEEYSIMLQDEDGNEITIIINENLIIQNSLLYYEVVDGPLDVDWLVQLFIK